MAWTTPRDWTNGEVVTETIMNTHIRDNENALYDFIARSSGILIESQTLGSDGLVTFSSIPSTYTRLRLVCYGIYASSDTADMLLQFNADTGNNYYFNTNGSGAESAISHIMLNSNMRNNALYKAYTECNILHYADTSAWTHVRTQTIFSSSGGVADAESFSDVGTWAATTAVSSIKVYASSGDIKAGARFDLFGIL